MRKRKRGGTMKPTKKKPAKKPTKKKPTYPPTKPSCDGCALPNECDNCQRFVCAGCERATPWAEGGDDDHPDLCDTCWCELES